MKNTFVKVLSLLMALMMVAGVFGMITVSADAECDHVKASEEPVNVVDPTCAKPGYKSYLCAKCKGQFIPDDEVIMPSPEFHKIETVDPVQASCLTDAYTGGMRCVNEGCPNVEDTYVGIVRQEGTQKAHSFVREVVEATCTVAGVTQYRCTLCSKTAEEINKMVSEGKTSWVTGQDYAAWRKTEGAAAKDPDHSELVWTVVTEPVKGNATTRCTEGLAQGVCKYCNDYVKTAVIPVHDFSSQINPSNSTCSDYKDTAMQCKYCFLPDPANNADDMWKANEKTDHCVGDGAVAKKFDGALAANTTYLRADGKTVIKYEEFVAAGLVVGTPFYVAPTCFNAGKQLIECKCGELVYVELPALGHSFANMTDADWNSVSTIEWATDCATPSYKRVDCSRCDAFTTKNVQEAYKTTHTLETVVVAPTCDEMGYTYEKCTSGKFTRLDGVVVECKHTTEPHDYTQKLEHNYGPVTLVKDGKCGVAGSYQQVCQQPNASKKDTGYICGHVKTDVAVPEGAAHTYGEWQIEAGTCVTKSKQFRLCSTCGNKDYNGEFQGAVDATRHEYEHYAWEGDGSAPTCYSSRVELLICKKCSTDEAKQLATVTRGETKYAEHQYKENISVVVTVKNGVPSVTVNEKVVDATCKANGYKNDGKYCTVCGNEAKAATVITKESVFNDIEKHTGYETATKTNETAPTCQVGATQTWLTSCCGLITITTSDKLPSCVYTQPVKATEPDCINDGNHFHMVCVHCGAHQPGSTKIDGCELNCPNHYAIQQDLTDDYVIPATGHSMKDKAAQLDIDGADEAHPGLGCYNPSEAAYKYCEKCDLRVFDGKEYIYNSKTNAKDVEAFDKAITIPAHGTKYMETFDAVEPTCTSKGVDGSKAYCTVCQPNAWILPEKTHRTFDFIANDPASSTYNCTESSIKVTKCMDCTYNVSSDYIPAKADHEYRTYGEDGKAEWNPIESTLPHCTNPTYKEKTCKYCGTDCPEYRVVTVDEPAVGHYVMEEGERVDISWKCTEIANFYGKKCAECKVTVTAENVAAYIEHNIVPKEKAPTCSEDGYKITYCADCNTTDPTVYKYDKINKLNVNGKHELVAGKILEQVPATATEAGYVKYVCNRCNVTVTDVIPATATLVVSGITSAQKVTAGTDVNYTVVYSGVAQTFKTVKVEVEYDATKFEFVEATSGLTENVFASADNGVVGITLVSKTDMTTAADGTALVDLKFTAKKYAMGDAEFGVKALDENENEIVIAKAATTVVGLGNATGTGYITAEDALAILDTEEFNAELDINGDGMVDLIDVALVGTFAASAQTAKDYLVMLGTYDEIQATIDELYANGKLADCNKDGIVTINDYYALIAEVEVEITDIGAYTNINFESVEEFVMEVMNGMIKTVYA